MLDGAQYGGLTLRAASLRGDSARHRGVLRRDALLTARFGEGASALLLVAVAAGGRSAVDGHRAARELCHAVGETVGRSHARLAEDVGADRRDALRSGLQRLTERCYGKLRAQAAALGARPDEYTAGLRCMVLSADPRVRQRVFFGAGGGGLFRLRGGRWEDVESGERDGERPPQYGDTVPGPGQTGPEQAHPGQAGPGQTDPGRAEHGQAVPAPAGEEPFRFQAVTARPHEVLLLCSRGLAEPLRAEAEFAERLAAGWARRSRPPGLADFLADVQLRVRGYADDRTAVALWER